MYAEHIAGLRDGEYIHDTPAASTPCRPAYLAGRVLEALSPRLKA